jgi:glutathione S-transferase-like protein
MVRPLKLSNHALAPNPRRVRIFAAEKGIELALEEVDILAGQSRAPEFLAKNSSGAMPVLELDDGSYLLPVSGGASTSATGPSVGRRLLGAGVAVTRWISQKYSLFLRRVLVADEEVSTGKYFGHSFSLQCSMHDPSPRPPADRHRRRTSPPDTICRLWGDTWTFASTSNKL